jgi:hypothetical protein
VGGGIGEKAEAIPDFIERQRRDNPSRIHIVPLLTNVIGEGACIRLYVDAGVAVGIIQLRLGNSFAV